MTNSSESLPQLRFDIPEVARILRISRATLYQHSRRRNQDPQRRTRTFVAAEELLRYATPRG